ncbi:MAG: hypothetical protein J7K68_01765 [Candidatus Diapherotrites archaeon]|nr:hypothetical protein [Candidatus Diapherotrites archaeon]
MPSRGKKIDIKRFFTRRARKMRASPIRELLKIAKVPGMIYLAGGLPSPESFPSEHIKEALAESKK